MLSWVLFSTLRLVTVSKKPQQMASEYSVSRDCRTGMMRDIVRLPGRGGSVPTGSRSVLAVAFHPHGGTHPVHQRWRFAVSIHIPILSMSCACSVVAADKTRKRANSIVCGQGFLWVR